MVNIGFLIVCGLYALHVMIGWCFLGPLVWKYGNINPPNRAKLILEIIFFAFIWGAVFCLEYFRSEYIKRG